MHNCELCGAMLPPRGAYFVTVAVYPFLVPRKHQVCPTCFVENEHGAPNQPEETSADAE